MASKYPDQTRRHVLMLAGSSLVLTLSGCRSIDFLSPHDGSSRAETDAALPMVNRIRAEQGLVDLERNRAAEKAAIAQAERMARAGEMKHLIGFNDSFLERMKGHDVPLPAAENIAAGQDSVGRAVQAWIDSRRHLDNMLGNFRGLGVAVAWDSASANRPYWAMILSA